MGLALAVRRSGVSELENNAPCYEIRISYG